MLTEREQSILTYIVREYITHAIPVSSKSVAKYAAIDASPATIRSIMMDLEDAGYLHQPHTSAGRLPTQRGYRFFVDVAATDEKLPPAAARMLASFADIRDILSFVSLRTHLFTVLVDQEQKTATHFGIGEVLQHPEFSDAHRLSLFGKLLDEMTTFAEHYENDLQKERATPVVFIEEENPTPLARSFSVVAVSLENKSRSFFAIGPSRMPYGSVIAAARVISNRF